MRFCYVNYLNVPENICVWIEISEEPHFHLATKANSLDCQESAVLEYRGEKSSHSELLGAGWFLVFYF